MGRNNHLVYGGNLFPYFLYVADSQENTLYVREGGRGGGFLLETLEVEGGGQDELLVEDQED